MKIAYISAGAGGMYCGACINDNTLAAALGRAGHEVALLPTYTPMRTDEADVSAGRVFYGAVGIYLEQRWALFRRLPRAVTSLLNRPWLLDLASRLGTSVEAADLGALTLSVLRGEEGRQAGDLEELVGWLRDSYRPEIVHLAHSMFLGMARRLREELGVPVVCSAQGEDLFLDGLAPEWREPVVQLLREKARDADAFVAPCRYYAEQMRSLLGLDPARLHVVPLGVNLQGHGGAVRPATERPFTVGYLARIAPEKGLLGLAEAFALLAHRVEGPPPLLRVAGYLGRQHRGYLENVRRLLRREGLLDRFEYLGEVNRPGKIAFLQSLDVLSVPTIYRDPKGLFVLEALANGVPVVVPEHGGFPEWIEATGGGLLVPPDSAPALADAIQGLQADPTRRAALGARGQAVVRERFTDTRMAERTLGVYRSVLSPSSGDRTQIG